MDVEFASHIARALGLDERGLHIDDSQPVVFDPAIHYADRECDLAMTRLFGGFSEDFYTAYQDEWPLESGHEQRRPWYQLYHVLNHANLFGQSYTERAKALITRLI